MEQIFMFLNESVSKPLFLIIILAGIFITKYTKEIKFIANVYKVLIASVIFSVVFYFIDDCKTDCLVKYLITYLLATSFYEIFVKWVFNKLKTENSTSRTN